MKINLNGSLELEKGEIMPFLCPQCKWFVEFDDKPFMVRCNHCNYVGMKEEFVQNFTGIELNDKFITDENNNGNISI